jgi:hypothetical protein
MEITVDDWRDGVGYDLDALDEVNDSERDKLVTLLAGKMKSAPDWRQAEALGAIGTPAAVKVLQSAMHSEDPELRIHVAEQLVELGESADLESAIINALRKSNLSNGLSYAIDTAEEHPSPRIQDALLDLALHGEEEQRIHCAALALYLGGKSEEAFDWDHRPFFLQFSDPDRNVQIAAYKELCDRLGVAPKVE